MKFLTNSILKKIKLTKIILGKKVKKNKKKEKIDKKEKRKKGMNCGLGMNRIQF